MCIVGHPSGYNVVEWRETSDDALVVVEDGNDDDGDEERLCLMTWQLDAADEGGSGSPRRHRQSLNCLL